MIQAHPIGVRLVAEPTMRSIQRGMCIRPHMRARAFAIFIVLLGALAMPLVPITSASIEDLGSAGTVAELDRSAIGWWTLENGNVLVASVDGYVTAYSVQANGSYAEVWSFSSSSRLFNFRWIDDLRSAIAEVQGWLENDDDVFIDAFATHRQCPPNHGFFNR